MKTIIVFGASGGTGKEVINQSLQKNFEVFAVFRNPSSYEIKQNHLHMVKANVLQLSSFEKKLTGKDAVISCLGTGTHLKPTKVYSQSIENILKAMNAVNVHRLICISAGAVEVTKEMGFFIRLLTKQVLQKILKNIYEDMQIMERILAASQVN
jgi:putative NADH-flavin reductase